MFGWSCLLGLVVLWGRLDGPTGFLFAGGELAVAAAVAVVIFAVVTAQAGSLSRALGNPVFGYVGRISYGVYLWHFPLFALLDAERVHLFGLPLLAVRVGVTMVVATASYYLVEQPIRRGRTAALAEWRSWLATSGAFLGVVALTVAATLPSAAEAAGTYRASVTPTAGSPVRLAILGDSVAWRLGFALQADQPQQTYGVDIDNGAIVACGVLRSTLYRVHGVPDRVATPCDSSAPASSQWPAQWTGNVDQFRPNVVAILAGRWEVMDRLVGGHWAHIGQPAFDALVRRSLELSVRVATSSGAYVVFLTAPCFNSGEQPDGTSWPEDDPARIARFNQLVRQVAAEHPATVRVEDFGAMVCPGGVYTTTRDGVQVRDGDGVHIVPTPAAGQWLSAHVLPEVVQVGRLQMAGRSLVPPATPTTGTPRPTVSASGAVAATATRGPRARVVPTGSAVRRATGRRGLTEHRGVGALALGPQCRHEFGLGYPVDLGQGGGQRLPLDVVVGGLCGDGDGRQQRQVGLVAELGRRGRIGGALRPVQEGQGGVDVPARRLGQVTGARRTGGQAPPDATTASRATTSRASRARARGRHPSQLGAESRR